MNTGTSFMAITKEAFIASLTRSFAAATASDTPYRHWNLTQCMPEEAVDQILDLPFPAPALGGVSGKREIHNATRRYFDAENMGRYPVCKAFCEAFQDARVVDGVTRTFGAPIKGSFLRVEFAQDTNGFWLEPHTDLGVKTFTMLLYLSKDPSHADLGTDIYDTDKKHVGRSPFAPNGAMVFVPSDITYHGFEPREIKGVRKSVIINYVTNDWRAREQLAYPSTPV
ncbi:MAG: 2OG-Fe(II) oxygenase [Hyphomicrobiaceae bacterium]|nr:2OG-Fe(II) oxygenase [Hyphomicrobiaceae bacterium]